MTFNIRINPKKIIPNFFVILKIFIAVTLAHYLLIPLIFETITPLGNLVDFWRTAFTAILAFYIFEAISIKFGNREWF